MMKLTARNRLFLVCFLSLGLHVSGTAAVNLKLQSHEGFRLNLKPNGSLTYQKQDPVTGQPVLRVLSPKQAEPIRRLLEGKTPEEGDRALASALMNYLLPVAGQDPKTIRLFFTLDAQKRLHLTPVGRKAILDILTAQDGTGFVFSGSKRTRSKNQDDFRWIPIRPHEPSSTRKAKIARSGRAALDLATRASFDHAKSQGRTFKLRSYPWANLRATEVRKSRALKKYKVDAEKNTLRVMIAADQAVEQDRFLVRSPEGKEEAVYREAGLDAKLLKAHGAKLVRAIDNIITVDVPLPQAAQLGQELKRRGIASRPARVFKAAWDAAKRSIPILPGLLAGDPPNVSPHNLHGRNLLKVEGLWKEGMEGNGTIVGIIDTGLDTTHPDFEGKILEFVDLTGDGLSDGIGHGTHVSGSAVGTGAASGGLYKGMAPKAKLVMFRVFDSKGRSSEDTILAAMKKAASLPKEKRPDVLSMSLGGPQDAKGPIASMANQLMLKENIFVAASAGNSGPAKNSVHSPGNARHILTVTGINKKGQMPRYTSRGPVRAEDGDTWNKPDVAAVAGQGIRSPVLGFMISEDYPALLPQSDSVAPHAPPYCRYYPGGVISARASTSKNTSCSLEDHPKYRYMAGTSMAAPMAAGISADIIGYLKEQGVQYKTSQIKALLMETASDLGESPEVQGAGLLNGENIATTLKRRVQAGLPVGNVAFLFARALTEWARKEMAQGERYQVTPVGILDLKSGHLISNDREFDALIQKLKRQRQRRGDEKRFAAVLRSGAELPRSS